MIKKLVLKNFKCFTNEIVEFKNITVLAGANAAGKSTIIQALLLAASSACETGDTIDAAKAIGIPIGNPKSLVSQNKTELVDADFELILDESHNSLYFKYFIDKLSPLKLLFKRSGIKTENQFFYLNAERCGPRISYPAGVDETLLMNGENAPYLIDRADMQQKQIANTLAISESVTKFSIHVEEWLNIILGDVKLGVSTDLTKSSTDVKYQNRLVDEGVLPTMTGFGISYILSVVTAGLWCSSIDNAVLIIENPEAHLHPGAQSRMGKFLQLVASSGVQVIVETHSEHIIDGIRVQAACQRETDSIQINYFTVSDNVEIKTIHVNEDGELSEWPEGFFDQKSLDLRDLLRIRRTNACK